MSAVERRRSPSRLLRRAPASDRAVVVPRAVAVLGSLPGAGPVGCAVALRLAAAAGVDCALVAGPGALAASRVPARRGAARLAGALAGRSVPAVASGRLVRAELADGLPAFARVAAAAPGPAVLLLGGVRTDAVDEQLAGLDAVVLAPAAGADPDVAALAAEALRALGHRATVAAGAPEPVARALALAGVAASGSLRAAADAVLEGWV